MCFHSDARTSLEISRDILCGCVLLFIHFIIVERIASDHGQLVCLLADLYIVCTFLLDKRHCQKQRAKNWLNERIHVEVVGRAMNFFRFLVYTV